LPSFAYQISLLLAEHILVTSVTNLPILAKENRGNFELISIPCQAVLCGFRVSAYSSHEVRKAGKLYDFCSIT